MCFVFLVCCVFCGVTLSFFLMGSNNNNNNSRIKIIIIIARVIIIKHEFLKQANT